MSAPRPARLKNSQCPYCGCPLKKGRWTEDHVVARRLVPKGSLAQQWNLYVRACQRCNGHKGNLEDELGALSMHPDVFGRSPTGWNVEEVRRRTGGSFSRDTGRPVAASRVSDRIERTLRPGLKVSFSLMAPPRVNEERAFDLAAMQLAAFFSWLAHSQGNQDVGWREEIYLLAVTLRTDWGRPLLQAFTTFVETWSPRLVRTTASGLFKVAIRKQPEHSCWSWALEWNQNLRIVGFVGDPGAISEAAELVENAGTELIRRSGDLGLRLEVPLMPAQDRLFAPHQVTAG